MAGHAPRMDPVPLEDMNTEAREIFEPWLKDAKTQNILLTLSRYPKLFKEWMPLSAYLFQGSTLATDYAAHDFSWQSNL